MKDHKKLILNLRENAEWAEANEWETPIMLADDLKGAAALIYALNGIDRIGN